MVIITKKYGDGEPRRMNPDSSAVIYVTASVEAECRMIAQNWKMKGEENKRASKVNAFKNLPALPSVGSPSPNSLKQHPNSQVTQILQRTPSSSFFKSYPPYPPTPSRKIFIIS